jgi:uncharacterized protein (UPF0548 family)
VLLLHEPSASEIEWFLARQASSTFTYSPPGGTRTGAMPGYITDHNQILLGTGPGTFARARAAVERWAMFDIPWLTLYSHDAPIEPGTTVAVVIPVAGIRTVNACRIVYVIDEQTDAQRYGFAYGTLPDHMETGEERFVVERRADDSVWYDLLASARPRHPLARIGKPVTRLYQRRFSRYSLHAMLRAAA